MLNTRLVKINEWNKKNLKESGVPDTSFAFYPFSGGDFIHLNWLLPNANEYLMVARENVGSIPNLMEMDNTSLLKYLKGINVVLRDKFLRNSSTFYASLFMNFYVIIRKLRGEVINMIENTL